MNYVSSYLTITYIKVSAPLPPNSMNIIKKDDGATDDRYSTVFMIVTANQVFLKKR